MIRLGPLLALCVVLPGAACKQPAPAGNPEAERKLKDCEESAAGREKHVKDLEARLAAAEQGGGDNEPVVITVQGDDMKIVATSGKGPSARAKVPTGDADDGKLYESFLGSIQKSRGAMKQCYQSALKKNSQLQARTISLDISVNYNSGGQVTSATFNPRISDTFDRCMGTIAQKWGLPASRRAVTFNSKFTLTPE
jgi:hypothetical protein